MNWVTQIQLLRVRAGDFDALGNEVPALNTFSASGDVDEERMVNWLLNFTKGKWAFRNVFDKDSFLCTGAFFRFEDEHSAMLFKLRFGCSAVRLGEWEQFGQV